MCLKTSLCGRSPTREIKKYGDRRIVKMVFGITGKIS